MINKITLIKGDITAQKNVDAIVTNLPMDMDIGGGLNRSIIRAAGHDLDNFMLEHIFRPHPGDVFSLPGLGLPIPRILCVITPIWRDGFAREDKDLLRCYRHVMQNAMRMGLRRIAFPALGTGRRQGFPVDRAARLAVQGIMDRMDRDIDEVRIVCARDDVYAAFAARLKKLGWKAKAS